MQNAEDRSIGTDTEPEDQYRKNSEAWILAQHAQAVTQILNEVVDQVCAARLPAFFFDALDSPKLQPRPPHRLRPSHAAANQIFRVRLHVEAQLRVHLAFHPRAPQHCPYPRKEPSPQRHSSSSIARRILRCPSSFVSQRHHRIYASRSACGYPGCRNRNSRQQRGSTYVADGVGSGDTIEIDSRSAPANRPRRKESRQRKCTERAHCKARQRDRESFTQHQPRDFATSRPERDADANLPCTLSDGVRSHAENADYHQRQRQPAERRQQRNNGPAQCERFGIVNLLLHAAHIPVKLRIYWPKPAA